jgi:hypothetical protein
MLYSHSSFQDEQQQLEEPLLEQATVKPATGRAGIKSPFLVHEK